MEQRPLVVVTEPISPPAIELLQQAVGIPIARAPLASFSSQTGRLHRNGMPLRHFL